MQQREKEADENQKKRRKEKKPGFDGRWYTDIENDKTPSLGEKNSSRTMGEAQEGLTVVGGNESFGKENTRTSKCDEDAFWSEPEPFTPENRVETHKHLQELRDKDLKHQ